MIAVPYVLVQSLKFGAFTVPFGDTVQGCGFALLLVHSVVSPMLGAYRFLNWHWVSRIGVLSYSVYIWQQIFCTNPAVFGLPPVWWLSFPAWLIGAFSVAIMSYYGLEAPLLRLRTRFRSA